MHFTDGQPHDADAETGLKGADATAGLSLLVSCATGVSVVPLGDAESVVIGRAPECDVVIADSSVSRRHAILRLGPSMTLEDLGSRNGTTVLQRLVEKGEQVRLGTGAVFELGSATLVLQRARDLPLTTPAASPPLVDARPTHPPHAAAPRPPDDGTIVHDPTMKRIYAMLDVIAPTNLSVLVLGETGVGKEVFAEALHRRSARASAPFLQINSAALPESLLEGELFGYEKGAFTGAVHAKAGLFESASGGTVFLDEIGEVPLAMQAKLLRVLESGEVMRLGSVKPKTVDARFVCATNRDLRKLIAQGKFRPDLFFRINGIAITLPPLRRRPTDVLPLARFFIQRAVKQSTPTLTPAAARALEEHDWPGNVRELRNVIERAVVLCGGGELDLQHLMLEENEPADDADEPPTSGSLVANAAVELPSTSRRAAGAQRQSASETLEISPPSQLRDEIESLYRERVVDALRRTNGNQSQAAKLLGVSRRTLITKMEAYGLERPRKGKA